MTINFKANFLNSVPVSHLKSDGKYEVKECSLVELDKQDYYDMRALKQITKMNDWIGSYADDIYYDAKKSANEENKSEYDEYEDYAYSENFNNDSFIAVTEQNSDFNELKPEKILGLGVFINKRYDDNEISWLQTKPSSTYYEDSREYKGVGKAMVDYMKEITDKPISVTSSDDAIEFYRSQGFKGLTGPYSSKLIWEI